MNKPKLTREKKNNLIAESQGWVLKWCNRAGSPLLDIKPRGKSWEVWLPPKNSYEKHPEYFEDDASPPDYFNDLNAMHEAVGLRLNNVETNERAGYWQLLRSLTGSAIHATEATAAQRAEAFGLTLGLWGTGQ